MRVIYAENVNHALPQGLRVLLDYGDEELSRAGMVLVSPNPVTTVYERPERCVLFNPERNANPFFHLAEALWMLDGRNDAQWLDKFVHDFSSRFAEADGVMHGAYGHRWRNHFDMEAWGEHMLSDQIEKVITLLIDDPKTRRAVLTMWDPVADLGRNFKDHPCNTHVYFRRRDDLLDMTVCCRSNDVIWGAYGANAVHFSFLLQYVSAACGLEPGRYYQISNNFHVYVDVLNKFDVPVLKEVIDRYDGPGRTSAKFVRNVPLFNRLTRGEFHQDLQAFLNSDLLNDEPLFYQTTFFIKVVGPMFEAWRDWKRGASPVTIGDRLLKSEVDWLRAAGEWFGRKGRK